MLSKFNTVDLHRLIRYPIGTEKMRLQAGTRFENTCMQRNRPNNDFILECQLCSSVIQQKAPDNPRRLWSTPFFPLWLTILPWSQGHLLQEAETAPTSHSGSLPNCHLFHNALQTALHTSHLLSQPNQEHGVSINMFFLAKRGRDGLTYDC